MASSASGRNDPPWQWPEDLSTRQSEATQGPEQPPATSTTHAQTTSSASSDDSPPTSHSTKYYPSRTCRICLETVHPTFHPPSEHLPGFLRSKPRVSYESSDSELGRLLRPCKCKGSSRYVHEGCLNHWRHADPAYGKRNFWHCPTCGFQYRLERMKWGRWINSTATQIGLTALILLLAMFLLGFVADPIINLYVDPLETILSSADVWERDTDEPLPDEPTATTWTEHFIKGLASLGVLSFLKVLFALSPWQWWNLRSSGLLGGGRRPAATGRDRTASISWIVVVIGILTFVYGVYKGVRAWSRRTLQMASDRVLDVPLDDDDEEELDAAVPTSGQEESKKDN
ncbi:hypothetical protein AJ80_05802 [Polytolypa hystricis UAMH7299]|uniref:RING-CH-type domain-containing protein n=1 Tax=Polytolypa hystricis (strain UAMH7299) TaxID=1447883 RepID=A0A2B7Y1S7_POLH7|nr:hypothetical protein AJ80_05802 [Polytolypa hystricis UAMH7299]